MKEEKIKELLRILSDKYYFEVGEEENYYPENSLIQALRELDI